MYKRVLIKLSGEFLDGGGELGIDPKQTDKITAILREVYELGTQIAVVIGAGNLWRGSVGVQHGMDQSTADHMGMIATVMNGLALQDSLRQMGIPSRVQTAVEMNKVAEPYIRLRAIRHMEKGRVVILTGGTGNPYFTTDTAAALRCMEINGEVLIKATKVDGIYSEDPHKNPDAKFYDTLTFREAHDRRLGVMDATAFTLCMDNNIPVIVLNFWIENNLRDAVLGEPVGTYISNDEMGQRRLKV